MLSRVTSLPRRILKATSRTRLGGLAYPSFADMAIDIGTYNFVLFVNDGRGLIQMKDSRPGGIPDEEFLERSVLTQEKFNGRRFLEIGENATKMIGRNPSHIEVRNAVIDGRVQDEDSLEPWQGR